MSRIGKKPINLDNAKVKFENNILYFEGPKGKLQLDIPEIVKLKIDEKQIIVETDGSSKKIHALWGLYRALIQNNVIGVTKGYEKTLEINGVGFRSKLDGKDLVLSIGFSHPVRFPIPDGISVKLERKDTVIILSGIDKHLIGQTAATIRSFYPPEPYKGKGIKYIDEYIRRKKGKRVA